MTEEHWPYGTVVTHRMRNGRQAVVAMVVRDDASLWLATISDRDGLLVPGPYYDKVWEWTSEHDWWSRVEDA
jgi:hypothetical protein